jgi:hypothetical protein
LGSNTILQCANKSIFLHCALWAFVFLCCFFFVIDSQHCWPSLTNSKQLGTYCLQLSTQTVSTLFLYLGCGLFLKWFHSQKYYKLFQRSIAWIISMDVTFHQFKMTSLVKNQVNSTFIIYQLEVCCYPREPDRGDTFCLILSSWLAGLGITMAGFWLFTSSALIWEIQMSNNLISCWIYI